MAVLAAGFQVIINDEKHNIPSNYGNSIYLSYDENTVYKSLERLALLTPPLKMVSVGPVMLDHHRDSFKQVS